MSHVLLLLCFMNPQEIFGKRIKFYRTQNGFSQEELAFKAGLDRTYIASVENGKRNVSIQTIGKFLKALDLSFSEFFRDFEV
jgi:transcriptional regulator with XRE-family HTH domain